MAQAAVALSPETVLAESVSLPLASMAPPAGALFWAKVEVLTVIVPCWSL